MFLEPELNYGQNPNRFGWIEVICGSMFSGKTEELIRRINRAVIANQKVQIFKPSIDNRYNSAQVVSHNQKAISAEVIENINEIFEVIEEDCRVVAIDEAQFFDEKLLDVCTGLANSGKRVIVAGLDMDYSGVPFGNMPQILSIAEFVTKVHAICTQCGGVASYSYRLTESDAQILIGEKDSYEPRCRRCFHKS